MSETAELVKRLDEFATMSLGSSPHLRCYQNAAADAADRLEALREEVGRGWQPIETAPKDGTRVLLKFPGPFPDPTEVGAAVGAWFKEGWWVACIWAASSAHRDPTHWMPLPPASQLPPMGDALDNEREAIAQMIEGWADPSDTSASGDAVAEAFNEPPYKASLQEKLASQWRGVAAVIRARKGAQLPPMGK